MTTEMLEDGPVSRFSTHGIDPVGSAGHYDAFLLVEWPLPWARDVFDEPALAAVQAAIARAAERDVSWRLLALVNDFDAGVDDAVPPDRTRIIRYAKADDGFSVYRRTDLLVPHHAVPSVCVDLVDGVEPGPGLTVDPGDVRDLLICSHGRRDRRCGAMGTRLYDQVRDRYPGVRVWRISHTGGHRFAPTAITFPEGIFWSHLDVPCLDGIVSRTAEPASVAAHYRGNAGFPQVVQPAEREAFILHGWSWLHHVKDAQVAAGTDGDLTELTLLHRSPAGEEAAYEAVVGVGRLVPTVACDSECDDPTKRTPEYHVYGFAPAD